jgi:hypothetical protein
MHLRSGRRAVNGAYARKGTTPKVMVASRAEVNLLPDDNTTPEKCGWLFVIVRHLDFMITAK